MTWENAKRSEHQMKNLKDWSAATSLLLNSFGLPATSRTASAYLERLPQLQRYSSVVSKKIKNSWSFHFDTTTRMQSEVHGLQAERYGLLRVRMGIKIIRLWAEMLQKAEGRASNVNFCRRIYSVYWTTLNPLGRPMLRACFFLHF